MEKVSADGVITVEESKTADTYTEVVEGMQFDRQERLEAENRRHRRVLSMRLTKSGKHTLLRFLLHFCRLQRQPFEGNFFLLLMLLRYHGHV